MRSETHLVYLGSRMYWILQNRRRKCPSETRSTCRSPRESRCIVSKGFGWTCPYGRKPRTCQQTLPDQSVLLPGERVQHVIHPSAPHEDMSLLRVGSTEYNLVSWCTRSRSGSILVSQSQRLHQLIAEPCSPREDPCMSQNPTRWKA